MLMIFLGAKHFQLKTFYIKTNGAEVVIDIKQCYYATIHIYLSY
jgi:hypothetical protein